MLRHLLVWLAGLLWSTGALAQGFSLPPFVGGVPGATQWQAITQQRHLSRTQMYQEALEELRRNPRAADIAECPPDAAQAADCLPRAAAAAANPPATGGRRRAVLIGNNRYREPIPRLETPIGDVEAMASLLRANFGFEVTVLKNAGKTEIFTALNQLARDTAIDDSVVVVYAGHGYLVEETRIGYWIPSDASAKSAALWISNDDITRMLAAIRARQVLLISDSCFSGSLAREQKFRPGGAAQANARTRSVLVFSSGDEEPVSDEGRDGHSIFAWSLLGALNKTANPTAGFDIYRTVRDQVTKTYPQEPQYGALPSAGHVAGGDYLFEARR